MSWLTTSALYRYVLGDFGVAQGLSWRYLPLLTAPDRPDLRTTVVPTGGVSVEHAPILPPCPIPTPPPVPLAQAPSGTPRIPRPHTDSNVSTIISYDIVCSWHVHASERMKENHGDIYPFFENCQFTIPLLHVQNHKDNCAYLHSSAFTEGAAHFHGETAEHPWFYINQFGGQGRQMSHGNRHDLYADVFNNWNFKKYITLREWHAISPSPLLISSPKAAQLFNELSRAQRLRISKRNIFLGLCHLYHDKIKEWQPMCRQTRDKDSNQEVMCVYRHNPSNSKPL